MPRRSSPRGAIWGSTTETEKATVQGIRSQFKIAEEQQDSRASKTPVTNPQQNQNSFGQISDKVPSESNGQMSQYRPKDSERYSEIGDSQNEEPDAQIKQLESSEKATQPPMGLAAIRQNSKNPLKMQTFTFKGFQPPPPKGSNQQSSVPSSVPEQISANGYAEDNNESDPDDSALHTDEELSDLEYDNGPEQEQVEEYSARGNRLQNFDVDRIAEQQSEEESMPDS